MVIISLVALEPDIYRLDEADVPRLAMFYPVRGPVPADDGLPVRR